MSTFKFGQGSRKSGISQAQQALSLRAVFNKTRASKLAHSGLIFAVDCRPWTADGLNRSPKSTYLRSARPIPVPGASGA